MIADELARARDACDALRSDHPLRPEMRSLLDSIGTRLGGSEGASRGRRPALPHRGGFLTKLAADHPLRPSHENAYEAIDALLELCWPSGGQTGTQRSRRSRQAAAQVQPELQPLDAEMEDEEPADQGQARAPTRDPHCAGPTPDRANACSQPFTYLAFHQGSMHLTNDTPPYPSLFFSRRRFNIVRFGESILLLFAYVLSYLHLRRTYVAKASVNCSGDET